MSPLRWFGLLLAAAVVAVEVRSLWRRVPRPLDLLVLAAAALLGALALTPALANVPAEVLRLRHTPAGRLITVMVLFDIVLLPYLFWLSGRQRRTAEDADLQFETLVGLVLRNALPPEISPVAVVMPAYNEGESIGRVLARMPQTACGRQVQAIVVGDGCTDETMTVARRAGVLAMELPVNRGAGTAIRLGYNYAARAGAEVVVTMDADGQHRPEEIERVVAPVLAGDADFVIGSRRLGDCERVSTLRSLGLDVFNRMLNLMFGAHVTDCSSGFRAFRPARLPRLDTMERQYHTAETIIVARRRGLRIREVPISAPRRIAGTSKKGTDLVYGLRFGRVLLAHWLRS